LPGQLRLRAQRVWLTPINLSREVHEPLRRRAVVARRDLGHRRGLRWGRRRGERGGGRWGRAKGYHHTKNTRASARAPARKRTIPVHEHQVCTKHSPFGHRRAGARRKKAPLRQHVHFAKVLLPCCRWWLISSQCRAARGERQSWGGRARPACTAPGAWLRLPQSSPPPMATAIWTRCFTRARAARKWW
jgi:hypothetical protein